MPPRSSVLKWLSFLLVTISCTSCQQRREDQVFWELEQSRIELQERLNLAEYRLQQHDGGKFDEWKALSAARDASMRRIQQLESERAALVEEIASLERDSSEMELAWIQQQRSNSLGKTFERLTTKNGRVLENASVTRIDDGGVSIRHEHGAAKLRFDDLTTEQQNLFGLSESRAQVALNREKVASAAYDQQVEQQLQVARDQQLAKQDTQALEKRRASARVSPQQTSLASNRSDNPLRQPATRFGSRSWSSDSFVRSRRPTYRYYYLTNGCSNPFYHQRVFKRDSTGLTIIPTPNTGQTTCR